MSKFEGRKAIVNKPDAMTHKKECTIIMFDSDVQKYKVSFGASWVGWYLLSELKIDGRN